MRLLNEYEIALVAGGTSSSDYYPGGSGGPFGDGGGYGGGSGGAGYWYWVQIPGTPVFGVGGDITITANGGYWAYQSDYAGTTGGGGSGSGGHQLTDDANDTPCVNQLPAGMDANDLNHLNDLAKFMGKAIADLQDQTGNEWGAIIYRGTDGQLYQSDPFTAGHANDMIGANASLPAGAVVVGYLHTHPEDDTMDERLLSNGDRNFINNLIENGGTNNITADPNLLAYVVTKDEATSYHTYVFDRSDRNATHPGCEL